MLYISPIISLLFAHCLSAPLDEPIRVDLPVYDQPQVSSDTLNAQITKPLEPENYPGIVIRKDESIAGNLISHKLQTVTNVPNQKISPENSKMSNGLNSVFSPPVTTLEGAILEAEGWGSKTLSIKENVHNVVAGIFQPKPIVDTIKEEEKYGNHGDKFYSAGRAIVSGAEGFSNFVSTVLEIPSSIFRNITRTASEKLNNLGGRLVGL